MDDPRLPPRLIAYHEAAHAVVARKLGGAVQRVDIASARAGGAQCVHVTAASYRVPGSRRIRGTACWRETTPRERAASALRQQDASIATAALAGVALEDIARVMPGLRLLPVVEALAGTASEGLRLRSKTDIGQAAAATARQHRTEAGRAQFFQRARLRAGRILADNWRAVEAVAEALLERQALDGREVDRLLQKARPRRKTRQGRGPDDLLPADRHHAAELFESPRTSRRPTASRIDYDAVPDSENVGMKR